MKLRVSHPHSHSNNMNDNNVNDCHMSDNNNSNDNNNNMNDNNLNDIRINFKLTLSPVPMRSPKTIQLQKNTPPTSSTTKKI